MGVPLRLCLNLPCLYVFVTLILSILTILIILLLFLSAGKALPEIPCVLNVRPQHLCVKPPVPLRLHVEFHVPLRHEELGLIHAKAPPPCYPKCDRV
jgi:hypothetical protein